MIAAMVAAGLMAGVATSADAQATTTKTVRAECTFSRHQTGACKFWGNKKNGSRDLLTAHATDTNPVNNGRTRSCRLKLYFDAKNRIVKFDLGPCRGG